MEAKAPRLATACKARVLCEECAVRGLAVCGALAQGELPSLAAIAVSKRLEAGQMLFHEGDPAEDVFTLTDGSLKLYKLLADGRRQIMGFLFPGDYLGLAVSRSYVCSAEALGPVTVCRFPRRSFMRLLDEFPALEKELLDRASSELAAAQEQMLLLGRKTARERVASFLVSMADRQDVEDTAPVDLPMNRADIADHLGLTIETVSRALTGLRAKGLIELPDKHHFRILNRAGLEEATAS